MYRNIYRNMGFPYCNISQYTFWHIVAPLANMVKTNKCYFFLRYHIRLRNTACYLLKCRQQNLCLQNFQKCLVQVISYWLFKEYKANSVYPDEVAHNEPPHLDLRCLQFNYMYLKVGSCPNDDISVQFFFVLFRVVFE